MVVAKTISYSSEKVSNSYLESLRNVLVHILIVVAWQQQGYCFKQKIGQFRNGTIDIYDYFHIIRVGFLINYKEHCVIFVNDDIFFFCFACEKLDSSLFGMRK